MNATVLWIIAVILAIVGIVQLLQGQIIFGIVLLIAAAAVGPGGWSVFRSRGTRVDARLTRRTNLEGGRPGRPPS